MDFKNVIIMSDLDGTLLDDKKEISPRDMESINEFCDKGGMFTIATGRGYSMARPVAQKLKLRIPAVIFNGSAGCMTLTRTNSCGRARLRRKQEIT